MHSIITGKDEDRVEWKRGIISAYLNKNNIDKAESGCLRLIRELKNLSLLNGLSFDTLISLLAEKRIDEIHEQSDEIDTLLDWIDDGLLSLIIPKGIH